MPKKEAHAEWVEGFKKRKKAEEQERTEDLESLAKRDKGSAAKKRAFRQELEFKKILSEKVREAEEEERLRDIEKMRQEIVPKKEGGKKSHRKEVGGPREKSAEEEILEVTPDMMIEKIAIPEKELDKDFTELEKEWFDKEPEKKKEILENNEEVSETFYKNQMGRLHAQDPKRYPSGEEYMASSDTLEFFDSRKQQIELELQDKFGYDILKGGFWAQYKVARKLDPDDAERFKKLIQAYKNTDKSYREQLKKHTKKFSAAIDEITPRGKNTFAERNRHPELGPPKFY